MLRKCIITLSIAALLSASVNPSKAALVPPPAPPSPIPIPYPTTPAAGVFVVGGFIGVVALLCIYDFALKLQGLKNWDGTPKSIGRDASTGRATGKRRHAILISR